MPRQPDPRSAATSVHAPGLIHFTERGSGPPLLLVHGALVTGDMFAPVIDRLAARHRVIVPDLRGHGRSRSLPPPDSAAQLASDLARLLDHLGLASAAVLGYSQGGAIAQQLALDHPQRCRRLVLVCTFAFNAATMRERLELGLSTLLIRLLGMRRFARLVVAQALKQLGPERTAWFVGMIEAQDSRRMCSSLRETMAKFDSRPRLAALACPTLVVAGAQDEAVPLRHAELLHARIAGSELAIIAGAGHELLYTHTDELLRATEAFLARPDVARPSCAGSG